MRLEHLCKDVKSPLLTDVLKLQLRLQMTHPINKINANVDGNSIRMLLFKLKEINITFELGN